MLKRRLPLAACVILFAAACHGPNASPTAPGSTATPPVSAGAPGGATITGSVQAGAASALTAARSGSAMTGLVVTVAGTSISSGLDAAGRFNLPGVPPGDVRLQFSGPVSATLPVNEVKPSETISLVVNVTTTAVVVESQLRSVGGEEQVEGRVESLPPTMPARTLKVAGRTIATDDRTTIRDPNEPRSFSDLEIGQRVHVKGGSSGSSLLATSIVIQNTIVTIPVNVNGDISALTGNASGFEFKIGSVLVKGDDDTQFFGDGDSPDSFSSLKNGIRVEVKGQQRDGFVYAQRIHVNDDEDDDDDGEQDESASIHGRLTDISGTAPNLTLAVEGTTVRTNADTTVKRRGDVQTLAALALGQRLHVVGTRQSNGSLVARKIEIDGDEEDGAFEIAGPVGGLQGTCPMVSFKVNGYQVRTTATTKFESVTCAALKSGDKVEVKGKAQADQSVVAETVTKK